MNSDNKINFLDPIFDTKVKCSCIGDDFYSVENLISNDKQKLSRGFMAYSVVKPPVEIEFQLCCSIELMSIKIWPQIDSLKSIGFEIHVSNERLRNEYHKTASHFNLQEYGIQFINNFSCNEHSDQNFAAIPFYPSVKNQLRKVKNIKLIIKQTARCVPVIKRIEIWGKVSQYASIEQQENVHKKINEAKEHTECIGSEQNKSDGNNQSSIKMRDSANLEIPESFLDIITYEIMAIPMVLPSGKTIDNSTLLKHMEHEGKWGRVASDPFTGQPFTDSRKPVLDVHLKSQIDLFLLRNCNIPDISTLPRTVGSVSKRRIEPNGECSESKLVKLEVISESNTSQTMASQTVSTSSTLTKMKNRTLDEAIRGVLQMGKYTEHTPHQHHSQSDKCFQCSEIHLLYTIKTCAHLICRNCLISKKMCTCKCGNNFSNSDLNKYHQKTFL